MNAKSYGPPPTVWVVSGPDLHGESRATLLTLREGRLLAEAQIDVPGRARFAARWRETLYVVGDDGLAIVTASGAVAEPGAALPPGPWCHAAVVDEHLIAVDYAAALVQVLQLGPDGRVAGVSDEIRLTGSGPDEKRQMSAHPHHVLALDGEGTVAITDLGSDRLWLQRLDAALGRLDTAGHIELPAGSGPRHTRVAGPRALIVSCELANSAVLLTQDRGSSTPSEGWGVTAELPLGPRGSLASEVAVSEDDRFAYVATRGDDLVAVADLEHRLISQVAASGGAFPQHLALVGEWLLVANQRSDSIACFERDPASGALRLVSSTALPQPVCIVI